MEKTSFSARPLTEDEVSAVIGGYSQDGALALRATETGYTSVSGKNSDPNWVWLDGSGQGGSWGYWINQTYKWATDVWPDQYGPADGGGGGGGGGGDPC